MHTPALQMIIVVMKLKMMKMMKMKMKMMKVMTMTMIRFTISDFDSVCVRRPCDVIYFLKGMSHTK